MKLTKSKRWLLLLGIGAVIVGYVSWDLVRTEPLTIRMDDGSTLRIAMVDHGKADTAWMNTSLPYSPANSVWCISIADALDEHGKSIRTSNPIWGTIVSSPGIGVPAHYSGEASKGRFIFAITKAHTIEFHARARNAP